MLNIFVKRPRKKCADSPDSWAREQGEQRAKETKERIRGDCYDECSHCAVQAILKHLLQLVRIRWYLLLLLKDCTQLQRQWCETQIHRCCRFQVGQGSDSSSFSPSSYPPRLKWSHGAQWILWQWTGDTYQCSLSSCPRDTGRGRSCRRCWPRSWQRGAGSLLASHSLLGLEDGRMDPDTPGTEPTANGQGQICLWWFKMKLWFCHKKDYYTPLFMKVKGNVCEDDDCSSAEDSSPEWVSLKHILNAFLHTTSDKYEPSMQSVFGDI